MSVRQQLMAVFWLLLCIPFYQASADATLRARSSYTEFLNLVGADDPRRAEAVRRLADLELERGEALLLDEADAAAFTHVQRAVALYEELLQADPAAEHPDRILYQLARAQELLGQTELALSALDSLIAQYPDSELLAEARFRRGEGAFSLNDYARAIAAYEGVVEMGDGTQFYRQSLYKLGWSRFRLMDYAAAQSAFFTLLDAELAGDPDAGLAALGRAQRELVEDSLRAVVIGFAHEQGVDSAAQSLDERDAPHFAHLLFGRLGDLFLAQERYHDAAEAYMRFVERSPTSRHAPVLHGSAINTLKRAGLAEQALHATEEYANRYALDGAFFAIHDPEERPEVLAALDRSLDELARHYHVEAQTNEAGADYARAAHWYRTWLASFPANDDAPRVRFLLAEILEANGQYAAAQSEYTLTAYAYPPHAQAAEAGFAALQVAQKSESASKSAAGMQRRLQMAATAVRFALYFPEHPQAQAIQMRAAEELFALGDLHAAASAARPLATHRLAGEQRRRSAWLVLAHVAFDSADYLAAEAAYGQVLTATAPTEEHYGALMEKLAASVYRQGEQALESEESVTAIEHFLRVAAVAPATKIARTAQSDAASLLLAAEQWERAAVVLENYRSNYPEQALEAEVAPRLAHAYAESGQYQQALVELEAMLRAEERDAGQRRDAGWRAAELAEQHGQRYVAQRCYEYLARQFAEPLDEAMTAMAHLARLAQEDRDDAAWMHWQEALITADERAGDGRTAASRSLAAAAALALAGIDRQHFDALRIEQPLAASLAAKKEAMERVLAAYGRAAAYDVAVVSTESGYRIAESYRGFAEALMDSPRPDDLDADALEQYELLLEEQAYPFEEQAIEIHIANSRRAAGGWYDEWVGASFARLEELVPGRFARPERRARYVTAID